MNAGQKLVRLMVLALVLGVTAPAHAQVDAGELVETLTGELGVTEQQASGGAGSIFKLAQDRLEPSQFSQLADAVPGVDGLLGAAPALGNGGSSGMLGGAGSALGMDDLGTLGSLVGPFSDLGMSPDMISQFMPVVLDYVQSGGGQQAAGLLQSALSGG